MSQTGWMLAIIDVAVPFGQVAIGLALLVS